MSFQFNSDILLIQKDLDTAQANFPLVSFALDHSELRRMFVAHNSEADSAKRRSRLWGQVAVSLGAGALAIAAAEPLYAGPDSTKHAIAFVAGISGVLSVVIGTIGVIFRSRKDRWLRARFATERLRQFHFQSIVSQVASIVAASADIHMRDAFITARQARLAAFDRGVLQLIDAEMPSTAPEAEFEAQAAWIWPKPSGSAEASLLEPAITQLLGAYEELRFKRQVQYARYKLVGHGRWWSDAPAKQAKFFSGVALTCVSLLLLVHLGIVVAVFGGPEWLTGKLAHVAAVWIAIVALSTRTLEEGLQPGREVERLRNYQSAVTAIHKRFRDAETLGGKIEAMREMEEASYDELQLFLHSSNEAKYIM